MKVAAKGTRIFLFPFPFSSVFFCILFEFVARVCFFFFFFFSFHPMDEQALQNDPHLRSFLEQQAVQARVMTASLELTDTCWDRCVDKIGSKPISDSGDSKTAQCFTNCVGRFLDASTALLKHMQNRSG